MESSSNGPPLANAIGACQPEIVQAAPGGRGVAHGDRHAPHIDSPGRCEGEVSAGVVGEAEPDRRRDLPNRPCNHELRKSSLPYRGCSRGVLHVSEALADREHAGQGRNCAERRGVLAGLRVEEPEGPTAAHGANRHTAPGVAEAANPEL
jgi:hypothetical protein